MKGNAKVIPMAGIDDLVDALTNDSIDGGYFLVMQISTRKRHLCVFAPHARYQGVLGPPGESTHCFRVQ